MPNSEDRPSWFSKDRLAPLVYLANNWISLIGVVVVTTATVFWLFLLPFSLRGEITHPYIGILIFLLLPGSFILGLVLIPAGIMYRRRRDRAKGQTSTTFPPLNLQNTDFRRLLMFIGVTTFLNLVIASQLAYSAVNYMDSTTFCGLTCHRVMIPEYTSHENSSHARVDCAACHIGPGASWFVRSKLSGTSQVFYTLFNTYPRPIPVPVANLRPARETCEQCHWPQRFTGDKVVVHTTYAPDEQNSATTTVLLMKVGGRAWNGTVGIHGAHLADNTSIEYIATDTSRQTIPQVIYTGADGKKTIYNETDTKVSPEQLAKGEHRTMDCVDCHNRPTHTFQLPGRAVDDAMSTGDISPNLPYAKKQALAVLMQVYPDRDTAKRRIADQLTAYYRQSYPQIYAQDRKRVANAIAAVQNIYGRNVFPEMKVTWGTYLNNLGHTDSAGCFRCHDGNHTSAGGKTIPNDCGTCHELKAVDEKNPAILTDLGIVPAEAKADPGPGAPTGSGQ
ncbi:MAG TPA: NapC/NirT family cytochrome c [Bryobacteraceae bacterium]|nr:NapC/NirT family cytochrome c [Bryobacteraceae bacterium]